MALLRVPLAGQAQTDAVDQCRQENWSRARLHVSTRELKIMANNAIGLTDPHIERLMVKLESLVDGNRAVPLLVACGQQAIPYLEQYLLSGSPRTIAIPRCRAVRALGELGAFSVLISYFEEYEPPADPEVRFAEDAVRSAVARELMEWRSEKVYRVLLDAARQRATNGLLLAVGGFRNPESVSLLFAALDDDLCREEAMEGLRKVPGVAREYAILSIRGQTETDLLSLGASRRLRATLQLLVEFGVTREEWQDLRAFLDSRDPAIVISVAHLGFQNAPESDYRAIIDALFHISPHLNWAQEDEVNKLLGMHRDLAREIARTVVIERERRGESPNWLRPLWRVLQHVLGRDLGHRGS